LEKKSWRSKKKDIAILIKKLYFLQFLVIKNLDVDHRNPEPGPDSPESLDLDIMDIDLNQRFPLGNRWRRK
jgi:hypothetical protein